MLFYLFIHTTKCNFMNLGQKMTKRNQPKFNRYFANISRECFQENRVTPERVLGVYSLNYNDREAKCYVACMLHRFNVTNRNGSYNEKELELLMVKPNSKETPINMKRAIEICEKEDDKDRCERAVKFTKCIYAHKNEFSYSNNTSTANRYRPTVPFGFGGRRTPSPRA
ncbi:uncharacterized protein LOC112685649 isoform X2 [Sipha flava]|uniref:Uncharacterized protein LOC112685649 isoform X2 n=1 Tax=Sipha flava TaxID=143950 RepID=A0A8B8FQZ2_9HEMI|nr:uncharacterized protein LOC112685649 isoform X2 [Sipha flava]